MTGCGSFSGVGCESPHLGTALSAPAPHIAAYVPHVAISAGGLPVTGADLALLAFWGCLFVLVGLLTMAGKRNRG